MMNIGQNEKVSSHEALRYDYQQFGMDNFDRPHIPFPRDRHPLQRRSPGFPGRENNPV